MQTPLRTALAALCTAVSLQVPAGAQPASPPQPHNLLSLSASAAIEVPQDTLAVVLAVTREGGDAQAVQSALKQVLDAALAEARRAARPGQLDVRTGNFALFPRHAPKGGPIAGWQGRAELVIEGRDMPAVGQLAGRLQGMVVTRVAHSLSREARERAEDEIAAEAIARFRARAAAYAKQFGFAGYAIRDVNVAGGDASPPVPVMRAQALRADESLPTEAGRTAVGVSVNGSVQMLP